MLSVTVALLDSLRIKFVRIHSWRRALTGPGVGDLRSRCSRAIEWADPWMMRR